MGRSKIIFYKYYCLGDRDYNLPEDPILTEASHFLMKVKHRARLMLEKQETVDHKLVHYWIWGMKDGAVVYRLESREGEQALSGIRVTIWPNDDECILKLEKRVLFMLPRV